MREAVPHMVDAEGGVATFVRVQLRAAGKDEHFLEKLLGAHPELLALDPLETRIHGKWVAFHQLSLATPTGRDVYPDIVFLSESETSSSWK